MVGVPGDCHLEMKLTAGEAPVQAQSPVPEIAESTPMAESPVPAPVPMPMAEMGAMEQAGQAGQAEQKPKKSESEKRG